MISHLEGHILEAATSRMLYLLPVSRSRSCRFIILSCPLSNVSVVASWCKVQEHSLFNYPLVAKGLYTDISIQHLDGSSVALNLRGVLRRIYSTVCTSKRVCQRDCMIFAFSIRQTRLITLDFLTRTLSDGQVGTRQVLCSALYLIKDPMLKYSVVNGVGFVYGTQLSGERSLVQYFYRRRRIYAVVGSFSAVSGIKLRAGLLLIQGVAGSGEGKIPFTLAGRIIGLASKHV